MWAAGEARLDAKELLNAHDPRAGLLEILDLARDLVARDDAVGSPVLDRGAATNCPATDQRGEIRPGDADADGTAVCQVGA